MKQKTIMISARVPEALVRRVDFAVRNTETEGVQNRSDAVTKALEAWALKEWADIRSRGVEVPKA